MEKDFYLKEILEERGIKQKFIADKLGEYSDKSEPPFRQSEPFVI